MIKKILAFIIPVFLFQILGSQKLLAQPGIGIPYGVTIQPTALVIPAGPWFNVFAVATDEFMSNNYIPTGANVSACPGVPTYPGFTFGGVLYSGFAQSSNGFIVLTNLACNASTGVAPLPTNALANNTTGFPIIAPLWDDLLPTTMGWYWDAVNGNMWFRWTATKWDKANASATMIFYIKLTVSGAGAGNSSTRSHF